MTAKAKQQKKTGKLNYIKIKTLCSEGCYKESEKNKPHNGKKQF